MSRSLLPLASMMEPLRGFVAVGRRMSITLAAADLCLTQSALSRQVQALESRLGVRLLVRGHRAIAFTAEGERLFRSADAALQQLQDAFAALGAGARRPPVTLSASIGVTGLWVLPRLGRFQQRHPDIEVRVAASNRVQDLAGEGIDLAIRYGSRAAAGEGAVRLFDETVVPVCHPSLPVQGLMAPGDLAGQVLLEFDDPGRPWLHWEDWLAALGWSGARPRAVLRFNQYDQVVQAAMAGQGIALGRVALIQPLLDDARLRRMPCAGAGPVNEHAYWLLRGDAGRPDVDAVVEWILAEAGEVAG
ncbi:LysR substrate-binding domain-containing protein [Cupriavidus respiraculi]|uniref:HTH-type transcriptional activator AmpR n=1 Tax=Cupriavidus respiraculi TaxID=195930 RepID=A0ABN7XWA1_9BURK|nr:LysR substrate-binding domain-containing protein [Cupriavidus respiraculi]CAG9165429.1 HTH-type transcriptional activator AmpR [Cupriavidus respiraculi]